MHHLLCFNSLAFVNQRFGTIIVGDGGEKVCEPYYLTLDKQKQSQVSLYDGDNREDCGGSDKHDSTDSINRPQYTPHTHGRRVFAQTISQSFIASGLIQLVNIKSASAACLSGDIRSECIGVYKTPIDAPESPYMNTPEKLQAYAPDLKWVPPVEYPKNYADALNQLKDQRQQLDVAQDLVAKGQIEKAGLIVLDIIPKANAAGSVILKSINKASNNERNAAMKRKNKSSIGNDDNPSSTNKATTLEMKAYRVETTLNELMGNLGETDVLIGQGLRGELGVSAPAQIAILEEFANCRKEFDNLLSTIPEKI